MILRTDDVIGQFKTAIGASTTIGSGGTAYTVTWARKLRGPVDQWPEDVADYPLIIFDADDADTSGGLPGANLVVQPLTIWLLLLGKETAEANPYSTNLVKLTEAIGEKVQVGIMASYPRFGASWITRFEPLNQGLATGFVRQWEDETGLVAYKLEYSIEYWV